LLKINKSKKVTWNGKNLLFIPDLCVYPRMEKNKLLIWIASGGTSQSAARAGIPGFPLVLASVWGSSLQFTLIIVLYKRAAKKAGEPYTHTLLMLRVD